MLTEQEISRSWRGLINSGEFDERSAAKAEALLGELRPESPLRQRLRTELLELRRLNAQQS